MCTVVDMHAVQGWKFFTKAKQWINDPETSVTGEFSKELRLIRPSGCDGGGSNDDNLELEEADIMHVGKAVEGEGTREGLYIR